MAVFCLSLGVIYSEIFNAKTEEYLPYVSIGIVLWNFISGSLNEFPNAYVDNSVYLKEIKINPLIILLRVLARHAIIFFHNFLIVFVIYAYFGINPGLVVLLALPALILVVINLFFIGVVLSILGARFRDISQMSQSVVQLFFFVTPIIWHQRLVSEDSLILVLNPFSYFIDILRSPLLGELPKIESWLVVITLLLFNAIFAKLVFQSRAGRITFWV